MKHSNYIYIVKNVLAGLLIFVSIDLSAQREFTTTQISAINTSLLGNEGDLYLDTLQNELWIGLSSGQLYKVLSTDDQQVQTFSYNNTSKILTLLLEDGGIVRTVDLSNLEQDLVDGGKVGEIQTVGITGGSSVSFSVADNDNNPTNEIQDLSLSTNTLSLSGDATPVDLSIYLDNTDAQTLSTNGTAGNISISGGNTISLNVNDADANSTNELQTINTAANTVTLSDGGGSFSISGAGINTVSTVGSTITVTGTEVDGSITNEIQDLSISGNTLSLSGDMTPVDLSPYLDNTDAQDLSLSGNILSLTNDATTVNLASYLDNTDNQNLNLGTRTGTQQALNISGGTGVTIDVADNDNSSTNEIQTISKTGDIVTLSLSGGSITDDHLGTNNQTLSANRTIVLNGNNLTFDGAGANGDVIIQSNGNVGIGDLTPDAKLDVENGSVRFSDYTGNQTGTPNRMLAVEADGDIIEVNTVKSSRIFYPPAVVIDVSSVGTNIQLDLYQEYVDRYSSPAVKSPSAPAAIPTYNQNELYYYITDYDTSVFSNVSVDNNGQMTYNVISVPAAQCTYINVVFVVK